MKPEAFLQLLEDIQKADEMESDNIRACFVVALETYLQRLEEDAQSLRNRAARSQHTAILVANEHSMIMEEIELLEQWKSLHY